MTMDVVLFPMPKLTPSDDAWQCECGSYEFWLVSDGEVHCRNPKCEVAGFWNGKFWDVKKPDAIPLSEESEE